MRWRRGRRFCLACAFAGGQRRQTLRLAGEEGDVQGVLVDGACRRAGRLPLVDALNQLRPELTLYVLLDNDDEKPWWIRCRRIA